MIKFNVPPFLGKEVEYMQNAITNQKICGDGKYTSLCSKLMEDKFSCNKVLLTTSCTTAIELAALLIDIKEGDEVICPSYTFVSTANPFVLRGAKIVFVDIRPDTLNIDEQLIEAAITKRTKAIIPVHYAGVACEMDTIMKIAAKYNLYVIEDAAQGVMSKYKGKALGTIGHFGCFSFHETKNYSMGEGGALLINDKSFEERAEIIREKGTNRSNFLRGQVDKYTWVDLGSSILPSDLLAAYLYAQLENAELINDNRLETWNLYYTMLSKLEHNELLQLPVIPDNCEHNAHMFYIKLKNIEQRSNLIKFLKDENIMAIFHYIPLHSSEAGKKFGEFYGVDKYTTVDSERILRLPLYYNIEKEDVRLVCEKIEEFFNK